MRLQTLLEARWVLALFALLAVVAALFSVWLSLFFFLLFFFTVAFFRDPERTVPADPNFIVAAADGTVMDTIELDENQVLRTKTRRVGIFLSIFDVHTNRAPINGRVIYRQHQQGLCLDARRPDCSEKNESMKGDRFGMIRFGSRTELYLPLNAELLVKVGDHVFGGSTIVARLAPTEETGCSVSAKSASPLREGERTKVRGLTTHSQRQNPHPALSL